MKKSTASAQWEKGLKDGSGKITTRSGSLNANYSFATRFEDSTAGTTPEELIGAAHASCYSMFLSALIEKENLTPGSVRTEAKVYLGEKDGGPLIQKIELTTEAQVSDLSEEDFQRLVQQAKEGCPISKALSAVPEITVQATLKG